MATRNIAKIDQEKCNGCGLCIPNCAEGALQIVDGKVKLISEKFCDGLGACLGHCPQDAIIIAEREAEDFDDKAVEVHLHKKMKLSLNPNLHLHLNLLHLLRGVLLQGRYILRSLSRRLKRIQLLHQSPCFCNGLSS